jgi:hypothetical protein
MRDNLAELTEPMFDSAGGYWRSVFRKIKIQRGPTIMPRFNPRNLS